ncbi:MAG TPA: flagellar export protein FliJ [Oscillospiraceae bacterium]|nr:flagellar export protein FliJ [Oscillospiraceae bacterium]
MKKFKFSLDKLLNYKEQILDKEKNELSALRHKKQSAEEELLEVKNHLKVSNQNYIEKSQAGMSAQDMVVSKRYLNSLTDRIFQLDKIIAIYEEKIQKQLLVVIEATKEVNTIQKLEEKQLEEYNTAVRKADENFIQEFVINQQSRPV